MAFTMNIVNSLMISHLTCEMLHVTDIVHYTSDMCPAAHSPHKIGGGGVRELVFGRARGCAQVTVANFYLCKLTCVPS